MANPFQEFEPDSALNYSISSYLDMTFVLAPSTAADCKRILKILLCSSTGVNQHTVVSKAVRNLKQVIG